MAEPNDQEKSTTPEGSQGVGAPAPATPSLPRRSGGITAGTIAVVILVIGYCLWAWERARQVASQYKIPTIQTTPLPGVQPPHGPITTIMPQQQPNPLGNQPSLSPSSPLYKIVHPSSQPASTPAQPAPAPASGSGQ